MGWQEIVASAAPAVVGGIAGLFGYDMQRSSQHKMQDKDIRTQQAQFDQSIQFAREQAEIDRNFQREMAQNSTAWNVSQLREMGLSPLGVGGTQGFPSAQSVSAPPYPNARYDPGDLPGILSKMGQGVAGAFAKNMTKEQKKLRDLAMQNESLNTEYLWLRNLSLAKEIWDKPKEPDKPTAPSTNDRGVIKGQPDSDLSPGYSYFAPEYPASSRSGVKAGAQPIFQFKTLPDGYAMPSLTREVAESLESDFAALFQYVVWRIDLWSKGLGRPWLEEIKFNKWGEFLKKQKLDAREVVKPDYAPKPNHYWKYDKYVGLWKEVPFRSGIKMVPSH